jgi:hypothetical protein
MKRSLHEVMLAVAPSVVLKLGRITTVSLAMVALAAAPVAAMDAGSLDASQPQLNCSQLARKVTRLRKQYEAEDYKLAQMQVQEADVPASGEDAFKEKFERQKIKVKNLKAQLREAERALAKADC